MNWKLSPNARYLVLLNVILAITAITLRTSPTSAQGGQASLTLTNGAAVLCHYTNTSWSLSKVPTVDDPAPSGSTVTWLVTATKGATTPKTLKVNGYMQVTNTGSAPATIGNIVVNLQKKSGPNWPSVSTDIADATSGDAATTAKVCSGASSEGLSSFTENSASGPLSFTDISSNTIWNLTPQQVIPVGQTVNLVFQACFNNTILGLAPGTQVRAEIIVTFGNSGSRGAGTASCSNIDANGNGSIDADEANVRSVPERLTLTIPALDPCNSTVNLTDPDVTVSGGTSATGFDNGGIGSGVTVSSTTPYTVSVNVEGAGSVCNTAYLKSEDHIVRLAISQTPIYDEFGTIIGYNTVYHDFICCLGIDLTASSCVNVEAPPPSEKNYCSYTQGGYQGGGVPGQLLLNNFSSVFSGGLIIGIDDGIGSKHNATWTLVSPLRTWFGGGGPSGALTADTLNATSTSGGTLAKQTATLAINVAFSAGNIYAVVPANPGIFGDQTLCNLTSGSQIGGWTLTASQASLLNGKTISQILADANAALGGSGLPSYVSSFGNVNELVTALNESYDNCVKTSFATSYLCQ